MSDKQKNQGEGNKAADRKYREDTRDFVESGQVSEAAEKAREAIEGHETGALDRAEQAGKKPGRS